MPLDPGEDVVDAKHQPPSPVDDVRPMPDEPEPQDRNDARPAIPRLMAPATQASTSDRYAPRSRMAELHRRRSQTLRAGSGSEAAARGAGVQKPAVRPQEQAASSRRQGSAADLRRQVASGARERMYNLLSAASAENVAVSPTPPTKDARETQISPSTPTTVRHDGAEARPPILDRDVEMMEASMPPPRRPATSGSSSSAGSIVRPSSRPLGPAQQRDDNDPGAAAPSSSRQQGSSLARSSSSNASQTVTIYECPILEVDEECGSGEDLSWLNNDQELGQLVAMAASAASSSSSSRRRPGLPDLAFKRSSEAAMQCSQVVRNVPRMRRRRERKLDRRRQSLTTLSESTICLSASPSPKSVG